MKKEKIKALLSILVVNEIIWIMDKYYKIDRLIYVSKLLQLLYLKSIKIIEMGKDMLISILKEAEKSKIDFTDLYLYYTQDINKIISFDKDFKKIKIPDKS